MIRQITNVLLVGVGGQGILLASEILSEAAMLAGFDVKKSEIHGMSQRGGSVVSHVRYGTEVFSPIVPEGRGHPVRFRIDGDRPLTAASETGRYGGRQRPADFAAVSADGAGGLSRGTGGAHQSEVCRFYSRRRSENGR